MRTQWCREHIDQTAKECGLKKSVVSEVKLAAEFCSEYSAFAECGTRAVTALIRVKDKAVRENAISLAEATLKEKLRTGGSKKKLLSEKEIKDIIKRSDLEVRGDMVNAINGGKETPPTKIQLVSNSNESKPSEVPESAKETEQNPIANSNIAIPEVPTTAPPEVIGGCRTLTQAEAGEPVPPVTAPQPLEPKKDKHFYANGLYSCLGLVTQKEMAQIKKEHPLWKTNADVFYYGVQALLEKNPQKMVS